MEKAMDFVGLFAKIAKILDGLGIKYCVTGGYAVSIWGRPRSTFDVDVVIQMRPEGIKALASSLRQLSKAGYIEEETAREAVSKGGEFNFIHPESGIKIDFWAIKENDVIGENELRRRVARIVGGREIYFISPEDLILSKLRWFKESDSSRHLEDIQSIVTIQGDSLDRAYLREWSQKQSTAAILDRILLK
jgi:hypothetical protein